MNERLLVFAREPIAGEVKTRLASEIGSAAAACVYRQLLDYTLRVASKVGCEVELLLAEVPRTDWSRKIGFPVRSQIGKSLGERILNALMGAFREGATRTLVIGSDCPYLSAHHLREGFVALQKSRVVLGPAGDGGYWLIGQRMPAVDIFSGISWSHPSTLAQTRARLRELAIGWEELELLDDIDTGEDLLRFLAQRDVDPGLQQRIRELRSSFSTLE